MVKDPYYALRATGHQKMGLVGTGVMLVFYAVPRLIGKHLPANVQVCPEALGAPTCVIV